MNENRNAPHAYYIVIIKHCISVHDVTTTLIYFSYSTPVFEGLCVVDAKQK